MRKQLMTAAAALLLFAAAATAQTRQTRTDGEAPRKAAASTPTLVGSWKSAPDEIRLTSDFDKSVWGPDATSVRTVDLVVGAAGEATLRVTKKVVDGKGRTVAASTWVEEAQLKIGEPQKGIATRIEHEAQVVSAVRLFPDDRDYRWPLEGVKVKVVTFEDGDGNTIEIRYDTPEGRGSFWETLRRERAASPRRPPR